MIEIKRITDWKIAFAYKEQWNALVLNGLESKDDVIPKATPSIFQTFEWNYTWWQTFGENSHDFLLLFAFKDDLLIGVAPLMIKLQKVIFTRKVLYWIGASDTEFSSDYCSFIVGKESKEVIRVFLEWLKLHKHHWDVIKLRNIPEYSEDFNILNHHFKGRSLSQFLQDSSSSVLQETDDMSKLMTLFPRNLKTNLRKLLNEGELTHHCWESASDIHSRLDCFFNQHIERRSKTPYPSFFKNEQYKNFFRMLVDSLSPKGWINLYTTCLNEKPIAQYLILRFNNRILLYTPTFDIQLMEYSPGVIQINSLFDYALKQKVKEINFGAGSEPYKYRYSNNIDKLYLFWAYRSWSAYALFKTSLFLRRIAKKIINLLN